MKHTSSRLSLSSYCIAIFAVHGVAAQSANAPAPPAPAPTQTSAVPADAAPPQNATLTAEGVTPAADSKDVQDKAAIAPQTPTTSPSAPVPAIAPPQLVASQVAGNSSSSKQASAPMGPAPLDSGPGPVKGKWNPILYGFVELDAIHDSTQSLSGVSPGFIPIARPGTYQSQYGRTIFDARGSRFGFRLTAPSMDGVKATAVIEADFVGNQPPTNYPTGNLSEYSFSTNPLLRLRQAALKVETPYVDVVAGQTWQLFGWQPYFFPLTVQIPSFPGEVYSRSPQIRVSHKFDLDLVTLEAAIAAARPPQRNTDYPDGQAGLRLLVGSWKGVLATGFSGPYEQAGGIGVSGVYRKFRVPEFSATPTRRHNQTGKGLSVDVLIPVIPGTVKERSNALTVTGSFVTGKGIADLYGPGTLGNAGFPTLPVPPGATTAPVWPQDIDNGLVTYDSQGRLRTIDWQLYIVGAQYYVPPSGRIWLGANYGHAESGNLASLGLPPARTIPKYSFWDVVAFAEVVQPVVVGLEYSELKQTYADNVDAKNKRIVLSGYYIFY